MTDKPDNVVVVLMDSLNRHLLGAYGSTEFETPNLDAFVARSVRFDKHYAGSLPCMPARHDMLCGALDFLWRPWGSIELWESAITEPLRHHGETTMLVSDHPHLFETGGENYHTDLHGWDYLRGGESDPWRTRPDPSAHKIKLPKPDRRARLAFMPGSDIPMIRQSYQPGDLLPHLAAHHRPNDHHCFDLSLNPGEQENHVNSADERDMIDLLRTALTTVDAPEDQFTRLGIA